MINIKYKSVLIICIFLAVLSLNAVCASDINQTNDKIAIENDIDTQSIANDVDVQSVANNTDVGDLQGEILSADSNAQQVLSKAKTVSTKSKTSSASVYVKDSKFSIQILYKNGTGIANQKVQLEVKNKIKNLTTNSKGYVYYKLTAKGTYAVSYSFKANGFSPLSGSKTITVVGDSKSKLTGSSYVAYVGYQNQYVVKLQTGGIKLPNKKVIFKVKGKSYTRTTNSKGQATLDINLAKGTYTIKYSFKGVTNAKAASGSSKITVKKGVPTKIVRVNDISYVHKVSAPFTVIYKDTRGKPIIHHTIIFEINGKSYLKKTDDNGMVTFNVNQKCGVYNVHVWSYNTQVLKKSSKNFKIIVKSSSAKNNGFWLFGSDMKKVDLNKMVGYGVNNIFLNYYAIELYGKGDVADFATQAKSLGINVHIWMQAFNDGGWISPVNKDGTYKYSYFNSVIKKAKEYASIRGVAGIHFDYLRFPGTAYKYANGVSAINYFTKTACNELHKLNSNLIVSAAIMPEPSSNKYYYGQDIPTISKYLDVIIPMVYKGNYNKDASWIKSVTSTFVSQSNGADVWTGLQGYASDSNVKKLSASTLKNDAIYAGLGGANGVIIFRYSLFNFIDFNNL